MSRNNTRVDKRKGRARTEYMTTTMNTSRRFPTGNAAKALFLGLLLSFGSLSFAFTTTTPGSRCAFRYPIQVQQRNEVPNPYNPSLSSRPSLSYYYPSWKSRGVLTVVRSSNDKSSEADDNFFDLKTTVALVGGQSLLIGLAAVIAKVVGTPNLGLGPGIDFGLDAIARGVIWSLPLGVLAVVLDFVEDKFVGLQEVTKATQSSVLSLLGGTFKPVLGALIALALGLAAGLGEEMLFRGVLQFELASRTTSEIVAVGLSSIIFGALHAVTPLYAILAALASVYFGWLYIVTGNLAIPIATHAFYDWAALLYAHWTVANMTESEQKSLLEWRFGSGSDN